MAIGISNQYRAQPNKIAPQTAVNREGNVVLKLKTRYRKGTAHKLFAIIEEPAVIERILTHIGVSAHPPPRARARRVDLFQADWG